MMRAVDIRNGTGPVDALYITEIPKPKITGSEALVKIKVFGLNRMDLIQREGHYPVPPQAPSTLGVEFSGTVAELASDGSDFKVGDEVFGLAYGGAYAEYVAVSTRMLIHKPKHISWEVAASIPETWMTSLQAMYLVGEYSKGKTILWHAGASSVSSAGIQLSRVDPAKAIYVTVGSQEKIDFCVKELGATAGFNYHTQDWAKEIIAVTDGKGVDVIIDFIGPGYFKGNIDAAARDGRIVSLGWLGDAKIDPNVDIRQMTVKRLRYEGSTLRSRDLDYQQKLRDLLVEKVLPGFQDGTFKVVVERVFPWEDIIEAQKLMESNTSKGKIVCIVS
ncbi:MAG: hypothetical protein M1834_001165 [Cirrosporium novae-zelandiae]|nr:MAG: hypothetical protein M1834_001165 [Cirrosporium novae-zelandiae]